MKTSRFHSVMAVSMAALTLAGCQPHASPTSQEHEGGIESGEPPPPTGYIVPDDVLLADPAGTTGSSTVDSIREEDPEAEQDLSAAGRSN